MQEAIAFYALTKPCIIFNYGAQTEYARPIRMIFYNLLVNVFYSVRLTYDNIGKFLY